jgi:hypothetical protein
VTKAGALAKIFTLNTERRRGTTSTNLLVPSKGLEPPHRCRYMDLNHARLPIPPRWQCGLQSSRQPHGLPDQEDLHPYSTDAKPSVKQADENRSAERERNTIGRPGFLSVLRAGFLSALCVLRFLFQDFCANSEQTQPYSSFAFIVILAFSTFDTGQPFSAASAYF